MGSAPEDLTPCEGGSRPVSRVLSGTVIHLGRASPRASSDLPGDSAGRAIVPLFGLAPDGVCTAAACCHRRGALLPHHFTLTRVAAGGIFSVALSVGSRRPGVTWHPALRSPDFPPRPQAQRLSGRLPTRSIAGAALIASCVQDSLRRVIAAECPDPARTGGFCRCRSVSRRARRPASAAVPRAESRACGAHRPRRWPLIRRHRGR